MYYISAWNQSSLQILEVYFDLMKDERHPERKKVGGPVPKLLQPILVHELYTHSLQPHTNLVK